MGPGFVMARSGAAARRQRRASDHDRPGRLRQRHRRHPDPAGGRADRGLRRRPVGLGALRALRDHHAARLNRALRSGFILKPDAKLMRLWAAGADVGG
jgi:hypothetical protein